MVPIFDTLYIVTIHPMITSALDVI